MSNGTGGKRQPFVRVAPLGLALAVFFVVPLGVLVAVSFFESDMIFGMRPALTPESYIELFTTMNTIWLYLSTLKFAAIVWAITLLIGFTIAYFLVFHVRSLLIAIGLFPALHRALLDLEHHPDDLVGSRCWGSRGWSTRR